MSRALWRTKNGTMLVFLHQSRHSAVLHRMVHTPIHDALCCALRLNGFPILKSNAILEFLTLQCDRSANTHARQRTMRMDIELAISMVCGNIISVARGIQWPPPLSLNTHYTFIWNQNQHSAQVLLVHRISVFFFLAIFAAAIFLPFYSTRGEEEGRMDFESGTFSSAHSMRRSRCRFVSCAWIKRSRSNRYFSLMLSFSIRLFKLNGLYDHKRCLFHVWQTFSSRHFSPPCRCERVCCLTFEHSLHIALAHAEAAVAAKGHSAIDVSVVIEQFGMECTQSYLRIRALVRWLLATQAHR